MKNIFNTNKNDKMHSKKCQNCIPSLETTYPEMQKNIYLEYININRQPAATRLMIDIKRQPELYLVYV